MCALCDPPSFVRSVRISQHPVPPDSGDNASSAGYHTRTGETVGAGLPPRCRMLAAGLTVSVTLCLAWTGAARITHAPAIPGGPVVRAMALTGFAGDGEECLHVPGRTPRRARGLELLRRGVDSLRQRVARAAHAPVAGPVISTGSAAVGSGQLAGGVTLTLARGPHSASTAADAACLLSYSGSLVRHPPPSSWQAPIAAHVVIRILAVRTPMPGGRASARLKHAKPTADGLSAGGAQRPGAASASPGHEGIRVLSQVGPGRQDGLAGALPQGVFSGIPPPGCVVAGPHGMSLVAVPPARCKACGDISGTGGHLGCGDRASLPGRPARYRVIWLVCSRCGAKTPRLFYDERDLPLCANSAGTPHGPMELQR